MADINSIADSIQGLTLLEASQLVKMLEDPSVAMICVYGLVEPNGPVTAMRAPTARLQSHSETSPPGTRLTVRERLFALRFSPSRAEATE